MGKWILYWGVGEAQEVETFDTSEQLADAMREIALAAYTGNIPEEYVFKLGPDPRKETDR